MTELTHLDEQGRAIMVEVGGKKVTRREAVARGEVNMRPETLELVLSGGITKGEVFAVARLAGIMAAKKTSELIPLCHPLMLTGVEVNFRPDRELGRVEIEAGVRTTGQTGVEMEAMAAVSVAALAIYDMCKAVDREITINNVGLLRKSGGRSGTYERNLPE